MGLLLFSFCASSRHFDTGAAETPVERLIGRTTDILFLPGSLVWTRWASQHLPNAVEWLVFAANSLLWGSIVGLVVARVLRPLRVG
jgi:hypothetical protein